MTIALIAALLMQTAAPDPTPSAVEIRRTVSGEWCGALGYRDYQSDRLFELPVRTRLEWIGDGLTQIRASLFEDGPANPVWITSVSLDDPQTSTVTTGSYRAGRSVSQGVETVRVAEWRDTEHWTLIYSSTAEDDEQPAEIRVTETRDGSNLMSVKEVRPVGGGDDDWRFRNQTRLGPCEA